MRKKLPLLFAAALLAVTFQTAMAADADAMDDGIDQQGEEYAGCNRRDGRFGRRMGMGERRGYGPAMPCGPRMMDDDGPRFNRHRGPGRGGMGMRMGGMGGMGFGGMGMMRGLDLSADQKRQMVDVMTEHFRERMLTHIELGDAYAKLRDLEESDNPDHDAIIAANEAVGAAHGKLDVLARKMRDGMKAVLTPEQQKKLDDFRRDRGTFRRDRDRDHDRDGKGRPPRPQTGPGPRKMD